MVASESNITAAAYFTHAFSDYYVSLLSACRPSRFQLKMSVRVILH
jgi:hypothetical protein